MLLLRRLLRLVLRRLGSLPRAPLLPGPQPSVCLQPGLPCTLSSSSTLCHLLCWCARLWLCGGVLHVRLRRGRKRKRLLWRNVVGCLHAIRLLWLRSSTIAGSTVSPLLLLRWLWKLLARRTVIVRWVSLAPAATLVWVHCRAKVGPHGLLLLLLVVAAPSTALCSTALLLEKRHIFALWAVLWCVCLRPLTPRRLPQSKVEVV